MSVSSTSLFASCVLGMCATTAAQDGPSPERPFVYAREVWPAPDSLVKEKIPGEEFFNTAPSKIEFLKAPEIPIDSEQDYVQRLHGWIEAPQTGAYRFAIASDDNSELWISTDEDPKNLQLCARVDGFTAPLAFASNPSQVSKPITMIKGNRYYLEARHRQGTGNGHLAVGWTVPRSGFSEPHVIGKTPKLVFDYEWFRNVKDGDPATHPVFQRPPDRRSKRASLMTAPDIGAGVATRLSGKVVAPAAGEYVFMISADDRAVLYVAPGGDPGKKVRVAHLDNWVPPGSWDARPSQISRPIALKAGQEVYIELLHLQGTGPGHAGVAWRGPNGLDERPIRSNRSLSGT